MTSVYKKNCFDMPDGLVYLDGNSLGPLPVKAAAAAQQTLQAQWGKQLIRGWNDSNWMSLPATVGDRIARLIGAASNAVVMGDTLSIQVYKALAAALQLQSQRDPARRVVLSDNGNFPTDLYIAEGLLQTIGRDYELRIVAPHEVESSIDDSVAALLLTEVDYRTGRLHDMAAVTARAHESGVFTVWDLAHSAGALDVQLAACKADFAVGCTYKYFNGGPGAPAFIYVAPQHQQAVQPALSGWLGHAAPFDFDLEYRAAEGIDRMRVGTPPVLALAVLNAALDVWDDIDMVDIRRRSMQLSEYFINSVQQHCPELQLASPPDPMLRGSQVSFCFEHGFEAMQALIASQVIGDFRAPDIMRFGITPLYLDEPDLDQAAAILGDIINNRRWDNDKFRQRGAVT